MASGRLLSGLPPVMLDGLPPILDAGVETLILGSFPSPASLAAQHYYAHRQNQFWRLLAALTGEPFLHLDYEKKQRCLLRQRIGVWDVYRSCMREGALDSAIEAPQLNDFSWLKANTPQLRRICFNGKTSGKLERWFLEQGYDTRVLPSTSPAYTLAFERKLELWRAAWLSEPIIR
ncbi:DNA-deoxyinosine glycosylase [Propionivibrio sp.]|uniref:DNA-deoxyinosine glycosylase n=1 Tax=Propionivibrio sp. TaxID=2212460 RepID=UPI003BF17186